MTGKSDQYICNRLQTENSTTGPILDAPLQSPFVSISCPKPSPVTFEGSTKLAAFLNHGFGMLGIFGPGAVVQADILCACKLQSKRNDGRSHTGAAGSRDRLSHVHALGTEEFSQSLRRFQTAIFNQLSERNADSSWHMAGAYARSRLRRPTSEAAAGARIQNLRVPRDHPLHVREVLHRMVIEFGLECRRRALHLARLHRQTGFDPRSKSAIENVNLF